MERASPDGKRRGGERDVWVGRTRGLPATPRGDPAGSRSVPPGGEAGAREPRRKVPPDWGHEVGAGAVRGPLEEAPPQHSQHSAARRDAVARAETGGGGR